MINFGKRGSKMSQEAITVSTIRPTAQRPKDSLLPPATATNRKLHGNLTDEEYFAALAKLREAFGKAFANVDIEEYVNSFRMR